MNTIKIKHVSELKDGEIAVISNWTYPITGLVVRRIGKSLISLSDDKYWTDVFGIANPNCTVQELPAGTEIKITLDGDRIKTSMTCSIPSLPEVSNNSNKVIFTTHDGVGIKDGDSYWFVNKITLDSAILSYQNDGAVHNFYKFLYFSTKDLAEKYISENKVLFVTEDDVEIKAGDLYHFYQIDSHQLGSAICWANGTYKNSNVKYFSKGDVALAYFNKMTHIKKIKELITSCPGIDNETVLSRFEKTIN